MNLTRFPLFFPEKRDFFLENSGQFTVSNQGLERLSDLFFSRRIGLSDSGQPIGIVGGARVTGKVGTHNVALMDLQTEELGGRPGENPAVFGLLLFFAFVKLVRLSVYVFMGAIFIQALLSWVSTHHPVAPFFNAFTRPILKPFQRAVPPIGGVDLSPLVLILLVQVLLTLLQSLLPGMMAFAR